MPTWGEILTELKQIPPFDPVRRKYIAKLANKTNRNVILYATAWTAGKPSPPIDLSINPGDLQGLMEVIHGLTGDELDLIIHSPGGSPEAAEALISYLRTKFNHIRAIIPSAAMSAATMLACAAEEIIMGKHSFIGPIDPQITIITGERVQSVPAHAILEQFELAKQECRDPRSTTPWIPILSQYGPALLVQCKDAINLATDLVSKWLAMYMFQGDVDANAKAQEIADILADHQRFRSHGRFINREQAKTFGLKIENLEDDQELQDLVLSVYHATMHSFSGTQAVKIIENHLGKAFVKLAQMQAIPIPMSAPQLPQRPRLVPPPPPQEPPQEPPQPPES